MPELAELSSPRIHHIEDLVRRVAPTNASVLILGESGVGRETYARAIHESSLRNTGPYVPVDLGLVPRALFHTTMFGNEKGAYSGAVRSSAGMIGTAERGTLVLSGVESLDDEFQLVLLRFLEMREVMPVGATRPRRVDARVIAIGPSNLNELVAQGRLRQDLYYRLNVIALEIPPLRDRPEDILPLAEHFLVRWKHETGGAVRELSEAAKSLLVSYSWPGNVRELRNSIERAVILCDKPRIGVEYFDQLRAPVRNAPSSTASAALQQAHQEIEMLRGSSISATPIWQGRRFTPEQDLCFVLMPFANDYDLQVVYDAHIKPTVERCGLRCLRADDIHDVVGVMQSVWENINRAKLIIADLTNRNPNVFYELGISHTLGKPVIMLTQSMDFVPFDLRHLRCIPYEYKPHAIKKFELVLSKTISATAGMADLTIPHHSPVS